MPLFLSSKVKINLKSLIKLTTTDDEKENSLAYMLIGKAKLSATKFLYE